MAFSKFFGRNKDASAQPAQPDQSDAAEPDEQLEDAADVDTDVDTDVDVDGVPPEHAAERSWRERAEAVLPTGASTGSKRASALWGDDSPGDLPTHFVSARGCHVIDVNGERYVDCTMGLGSVALGYAEPRVTRAVQEAAGEGNVAALSSWREVELADRLCSLIPCAERVQLLKSGAEATAAAVRLARTYTGRERVVASGYFGWHDWATDAEGVPRGVRADTARVSFDEIEALEQAVADAGTNLAAIIIEPIVERLPSEAWLHRARALCDTTGAVLIFDEIKTGFRVAPGGYQEASGITPDLATFGKALANGYPLAAVVGREAVMDAARRTWISSTLASESTALAAALAVLDWHEEADICATLADTGRELRGALDRAIAASGLSGVATAGVDTMMLLRWDDPSNESLFVREAARAGVLFKRGAYNFAAIAHDDEALREIEAAASGALVALAEHLNGR